MVILVTGGFGFIGSHVVKELVENKCDVVVMTQSNQRNLVLEDIRDEFEVVKGNIASIDDLTRVIERYNVTRVIHLAAVTSNNKCELHPVEAFEANVLASVSLMESSRRKKLERLIIASSAAVFSRWKDIQKPIFEDDTPDPKNMYSTHKYCIEQMARVFKETFDTPVVINRLSRVYGPGMPPTSYKSGNEPITQLLYSYISDRRIILETGGEFYADFSYVKDVAHGIVLSCIVDPLPSLIQNIGSGELKSIKDIANIIRQMDPLVKISIGPSSFPYDKNAPMRGAMDITRAREELEFSPRFTLKSGVLDYYHWLKKKIAP